LAALSLTLASCGRLTRSEGDSSTAVVDLPKMTCPPVEPRLTPQLCTHLDKKPILNRDLRQAYEELLACTAEANKNAREIREQQAACEQARP
jgi:hypothetical protein